MTAAHDFPKSPLHRVNRRAERRRERLFTAACLLAILAPLGLLLALLGDLVSDAWPRLDLGFLRGLPSRDWARAGIWPALLGSVELIGLTILLALPVGVGAAVWLEEYEARGVFARLVELNIANLAGVPSVIYGLLGVEVFVRVMAMGRSLLAGACTLALLVLPIVILASREALRAVPGSLREGALALGATRWRVVSRVVLPMALPGILTGAILATSRAMGETAPILIVGAVAYITFAPYGPTSPFTALPIQIFNWVARPQAGFAMDAAAGIVALLLALLALNAGAILLRDRLQTRR